jgi:hypothetical protein
MAGDKSNLARGVTWFFGALVVALIGSWAWARFRPDPLERPHTSAHTVIRVQVLNGSGESGIALRAASYLRDGGFQVVEVRNADRSDYFETLVVARRADLTPARQVASYLGSPPVIRQAWDSDLADVTLVLGSDRSRVHLEP